MNANKEKKELKMNRECVFSEKPPFPKNMLIELTNACNHKCVFCAYKKMERKLGVCDKGFMFDIMKQAYDNGTREVGFYMIGEPLLCKELEDYVNWAKNLGYIYIYITTNGALAEINRMKKLLDAGLNSVKFSVNAATCETYKKVHGKDDYEKVKKNIYDLKKYIDDNNLDVPIFISYISCEWNKSEVDLLYNQFEHIVDNIYVLECIDQGGNMPELVNQGIVKEIKTSVKLPCTSLFNRLNITYQGYLDACCVDINNYLAAVDLHNMSLKDAWYSDIMVNLRRQHLSGQLDKNMCYNCVYASNALIKPICDELAESVRC